MNKKRLSAVISVFLLCIAVSFFISCSKTSDDKTISVIGMYEEAMKEKSICLSEHFRFEWDFIEYYRRPYDITLHPEPDYSALRAFDNHFLLTDTDSLWVFYKGQDIVKYSVYAAYHEKAPHFRNSSETNAKDIDYAIIPYDQSLFDIESSDNGLVLIGNIRNETVINNDSVPEFTCSE